MADEPAISVIIPTLNEAGNLDTLMGRLGVSDMHREVIVVDGGSTDTTRDVARRHGARLLRAGPGRGQQLAVGSEQARGEVLLFLHADSRPALDALGAVVHGLEARPEAVGGNFRLLFDGGRRFDRWLIRFYAWIRRRGLYYGDSGIFVRGHVYRAIGGFRDMAVMEDYDFVRRLERGGITICIAEPPLITSSRRFQGRHPARIVWGWLKIHALFHLGVPPARLARLYDSLP